MLPVFYCSARRFLSPRFVTLHCNVLKIEYSSTKSSPAKANHPSKEQVQIAYDALSIELPKYFSKSIDLNIYANDLIFEDNIRNVKTIGKSNYMLEMFLLRLKAVILFTRLQVDILKMTQHPEEGTIKVRWTVHGISNLFFIKNLITLGFLKQLLSPSTDSKVPETRKYDGFSIFYINGDGLIQKHLADKMIPDNESLKEKLVPKLAKKVTNVAV